MLPLCNTNTSVVPFPTYLSDSFISDEASVLGLCWLHNDTNKFIVGCDNGNVKLFDVGMMQSELKSVLFSVTQ